MTSSAHFLKQKLTFWRLDDFKSRFLHKIDYLMEVNLKNEAKEA